MPQCRYATETFQGGGVEAGGLWNWGTSINISSITQEKEASQGNILKISLLDTLKTFLSKIKTLLISKRAEKGSHLPPSCATVNAAEYASISLNISKYP